MSPTRFFLVVLKDKKADRYFYGKIPIFLSLSPVETMENFLNFRGKDGSCPYKKLSAFVDKENDPDWFTKLSSNTFRTKSYTLDEVNEIIYRSQLKMISKYGDDCILNDRVFNPKKIKCECGLMVYEESIDHHKSNYCRLNAVELDIDLGDQ